MRNRIFDAAIDIYIKEYEAIEGSPYDDEKFPTPASVPEHLFEIVSAIKQSRSDQRQFEIFQEIRHLPKFGDVVNVPADKTHLLDEFDAVKSDAEKWYTI
ncbi:MAG: hypothetical protein ACYCY5_09295 [Sulfuricella sp.]